MSDMISVPALFFSFFCFVNQAHLETVLSRKITKTNYKCLLYIFIFAGNIKNVLCGCLGENRTEACLYKEFLFTILFDNIFKPIALRKAKIGYSFGLSECNRVNIVFIFL